MKKDYMVRLERWARWMLPRQEADDVLADYREIVGDPPRPEEELLRDLGRPREVIRPLAEKKAYYSWLAAFAVMAGCIVALGISPTMIGFPLWRLFFDGWTDRPYSVFLTILGAVLALVWFRLGGRRGERLPRAVPILLVIPLLCIAGVLLFCWACAQDFDAFLEAWGRMPAWIGPNTDVSRSFYLSRVAMCYVSPVLALIGTYSLFKARTTGERRWAAVYVLGLTAVLTALSVLDWTGRMDVTTFTTGEEAFRWILVRCCIITAIGLAGTGVALC